MRSITDLSDEKMMSFDLHDTLRTERHLKKYEKIDFPLAK